MSDLRSRENETQEMSVTIIIPTIMADEDMLNRCLFQVAATTPDENVEVLVPCGGTFAENVNQGARDAQGEVLVFLNDDTLPRPGWLAPLVASIEAGYGIVGGQCFYPDGTIQHAGVYFTSIHGQLHGQHWMVERPAGEVDAVTGALLAIRKTLFDALGGFDEAFRNGNEDVDLCLRARQAGHSVYYQPDSQIVHYESKSGPARWAYVGENVRLLNERWTLQRD